MRDIRLVTEAWSDVPGLDTGVSHALARAVGSGRQPGTLRLHSTGPIVAFGRRDTVESGYREAVAATRRQGFLPIERLAGGRAAVFHEHTLAFSWAIPVTDPRAGVEARFRLTAEILGEAFRCLGVDAVIGEVPGEYCPGAYSISAGGRVKIAGVGQRLVRGAAHVGGVIVVDGDDRIREVLLPVYAALRIPWDPTTVGSISAEIGPVSLASVMSEVRDSFERRFDLVSGSLPEEIVNAGRSLAGDHVVDD